MNAHRSLYGNIIVMAQNCSWKVEKCLSHVVDILFHSLGPLSSALSADWCLRNTNEGDQVSAIPILSEAFGIEGFTISITWSWILKQWREFNKDSVMAFLADEWVTRFWKRFKHFGTQSGVRLIDPEKFLTTTCIKLNMSFTVHIFTGCDTHYFCGPGEVMHFQFLTNNTEIIGDSHDLDQN